MRFFLAIATTLFAFWSTASFAQDIGIQFAKMPKGTKFYYEDYEGDKWVVTYTGRNGSQYRTVEVYNKSGDQYRRMYDTNGHMKSVVVPGNYRITYSPRSCERVMGACQYHYKGFRTYNGKYTAKLVKSGKGYAYGFKRMKSNETIDSHIVLGPYNMLQEKTWKSSSGKTRWVRLVKVQTP